MNAQVEKFVAPVQALNALAVDNIEKLVDLQVKRFEETAKLGIQQWKEATAIKDLDGFKAYWTKSAELAKTLAEQAVEDARTVVELGNSYSNEAQRIYKDSVQPQ